MKRARLTNFLLGLLAVLLTGIGAKVWQGVEIARENQAMNTHQADDIRENRTDVKELRSDLDWLYGATNRMARGEQP